MTDTAGKSSWPTMPLQPQHTSAASSTEWLLMPIPLAPVPEQYSKIPLPRGEGGELLPASDNQYGVLWDQPIAIIFQRFSAMGFQKAAASQQMGNQMLWVQIHYSLLNLQFV